MADATPIVPPPPPPPAVCAACQTSLTPGVRFCLKCGSAVARPVFVEAEMPPSIQTIVRPPSFFLKILAPALICVAMALSYALAAVRYHGFSAEQFGYALGQLLLPLIIAFLMNRKKMKTAPGLSMFLAVFGGIFLFVVLMDVVGISSDTHAVPLKDLIRNSVREASGGRPSGEKGTADQQRVAALVRDLTRHLMEARNQHDQEARPYLETLSQRFTAHSFSSRPDMEQMRDAVDGLHKIDLRFADTYRAMPQTAKKRVDTSDLSGWDKESFLKGFNQSFAGSELTKAWEARWQVGDQWSSSVQELYGFTLEHVSQIRIVKGKIIITGHETLVEFNSRLTRCRELDTQMIAAQKKIIDLQQANMKSLGLTNEDLGIKQ